MKTLNQNLWKRLTSTAAVLTVASIFLCSAKAQDDQRGTQSNSVDPAYSQIGNGLFIPNQSPSEADATQTYQSVGNGLFLQVPDALVPNTSQFLMRPMMIGNDQRMAVVYECWYSLRVSATSPSGGAIGPPWSIWSGYTASNWDYLDSDASALNFVRSLPTPGPYCSTSNFRYSPTQMQYGHGGQCTFFVTLIIKRARNKTLMGRGWSYPSGCPLVKNPQDPNGAAPVPGDIIFYYTDFDHSHVAIVVNTPSNGIEVVDSNDVGYGQSPWRLNTGFDGASSEIISRHTILWGEIHSKHYKVYSGNGQWYNTSW